MIKKGIYKELNFIPFDNLNRAITNGQSVVFYSEDILIGGGIIEENID